MPNAEWRMPNGECRMPNGECRMISDNARRKAVWGGRIRLVSALALAAAVLFALTSCSNAIRTGQASSYLILTSLTGGSGSGTVHSDVISNTGTIIDDSGQATFQLAMKDAAGLASTDNNSITITQYHVEYVRSDGRNTPGVDVPFAFDGGTNLTVNGSGSIGFTLVRIQAKEEAPLKALAQGGGADVISTIARVTFYGHDQTGRDVSVTGNIEVDFDDWAG